METSTFRLSDVTALVLGVGDGLEQAITRELAVAGAATLTAGPEASLRLAQHGTDVPHWASSEDEIDEAVVARLSRFLADQDRVANLVVAQVDVVDHTPRFGRWGPLRKRRHSLTPVMLRHLRTVVAAVPNRDCSVVLVFRMHKELSELDVVGWLEYVMLQVVARSEEQHTSGIRVNAILLGDDDTFAEAAHVIAFLASPYSTRISGAFIPVDDGRLLKRAL